MNYYKAYLDEIVKRKKQGLNPKPIDDGKLVRELVIQIKDKKNRQGRNTSA